MYRLTRLSLAHRSVVALVTVAIAVFGVISLTSLQRELIPSLQVPMAVVVAVDPGASPQIVEEQVTTPIEQAVRSVANVEQVTSTSSTNVSSTTVRLAYGIDLDKATSELQRAVDAARTSLPSGVEPSVFTGSLDDLPVLQIALSGATDNATLEKTVTATVVPRLERIAGVRDVAVTGVADQGVTVTLDLAKLAAAGLTPADVTSVLKSNGVVLPTGTVSDGDRTLSVQAGSAITSVDDLKALPLLSSRAATGAASHAPVTVGDVADVVVAPVPATSYSRVDGNPALAVAITKTPQGNTVDVSHGVQDAIAELQGQLGDQLTMTVVFDQAPFITDSISGLGTEGLLGLAFAVIVILVFLVSISSTLVSAISIPLSLLVTFIALRLGGYSLNILTLGAMTVAIGRVVDDSIVVIENINRHLSYGERKRDAILTSVREVGGAVTASTATTVAVFLPIGLVGGMVGELFRPFAVTVAVAMIASLFVALIVVPVLAYWFLPTPKASAPAAGATADESAAPSAARSAPDDETAPAGRHSVAASAGATVVVDPSGARTAAEDKERRGWMQRGYLATLRTATGHPVVTVLLALLVFAGTLALVPGMQTSFLGSTGQNTLTVTESFAPGTSLAAQDSSARTAEQALMGVAGVKTVQSTVGSASGIQAAFAGAGAPHATFALTLADGADPTTVQTAARAALPAGGQFTVAGADAAYGSSTVDVVVQADDPTVLANLANQVQQMVQGTAGTSDVTNNLAQAQPTVRVTVDRAKAAAAGLSETAVAGTIAAVMSPQPIGTVDLGDGPIDVTVVATKAPQTVAQLQQVVLPSAAGPVPLTSVASVATVDVPTSITRIDGHRAATISATPSGQDLGKLTSSLRSQIAKLDVPAGATVAMGGVASDQQSAFGDLGLALLVAIAIVYVIMVGTFGSLLQPLILLVSIPFAATGALIGLRVTNTPLGVAALIGLLMLVGIVVTNAIVLIDLVNQYRRAGRPLDEAVREGARKRLRPIIMTAAAAIGALLPMAFGLTGGGVFISKPLAIVVIGGLFTSTLLTLVLVPVLYTLLGRAQERGAARRAARRARKAGGAGVAGTVEVAPEPVATA
ncbi:MAG TPA: efflux RND transporter permease subunit [Cellulomonas sp.]